MPQFTFGQSSDKPKIRIVVFASGWKDKQEYDNLLVKELVSSGYSVDVFSYDSLGDNTKYKRSINVKRTRINLLNKTEAQNVIKELNDNAQKYQHTVYINGF